MRAFSLLPILLALISAPLLPGIINRTKAWVAGRTGVPLLQFYYDLARLLRKGAVYSTTTTWIFRLAPPLMLGTLLCSLTLLPLCGLPAFFPFAGDPILLVGLFALIRFFIILMALDTGSPFEGMGASREAYYAVLCEPALFLALLSVAQVSGGESLSDMVFRLSFYSPEMVLAGAALFVVFLCENSRIPFDDPNTHLELTMVHEVMVLDNSGPDFAFILYAQSLKLWIFGSLILMVLFPFFTEGPIVERFFLTLAGLAFLSVITGVVESVMARLRLTKVPQLLAAAVALSALSFILGMR